MGPVAPPYNGDRLTDALRTDPLIRPWRTTSPFRFASDAFRRKTSALGLAPSWGRPPASLPGVRPRYVSLRRAGEGQEVDSGVPGVVDVTEPMGREMLAHVRMSDDLDIRAPVPIRGGVREGEPVAAWFDEPHARLFDAESGASPQTTD